MLGSGASWGDSGIIPSVSVRTGAVRWLVGVTGFEPATPASRTQYSTRLSYTPNGAA
jgi:hypothetical protein